MADEERPGSDTAGRKFRTAVWLGVAAVVGIGTFAILPRDHNTGPPVGTIIDAELTLITSDRTDVACLSHKTSGRYACGFIDETRPRPIDERDLLRPYMTGDRQVYLIPGLFLEPNVARRFQAEPPKAPRTSLRRFTAKCKLKKLGQLNGFRLRWAETGAWSEPQGADVVTVVGCEVIG